MVVLSLSQSCTQNIPATLVSFDIGKTKGINVVKFFWINKLPTNKSRIRQHNL